MNADCSGRGWAAPQDQGRRWGRADVGVLVSLHSSSFQLQPRKLQLSPQPAEGGSLACQRKGKVGGGGGLGNPELPPLHCPEPGPSKPRVSSSPKPAPKGLICPGPPPCVPRLTYTLIPSARTPTLVSRKGHPFIFLDGTSSGSPVRSPLCPIP